MQTTSPTLTDEDRPFLDRARELAHRGRGHVLPNPMVGCVLVREHVVVGEGWHERYGSAHAEVNALALAGDNARGSTAYVSLEPCRHEGKTPACTRALIAAGVARVVFGAADPGADSSGGARELAQAGLDVVGPVLSPLEGYRDNPAFFHRFTSAGDTTPYIAAKLALSLDGAIAAAPGERTQLTGPEAAQATHELRAGFDAIVVGANTARIDDPMLTVRHGFTTRRPLVRIVLDPSASLADGLADSVTAAADPQAAKPRATALQLVQTARETPTWVICSEQADAARVARLEAAGVTVHRVASDVSRASDVTLTSDVSPASGDSQASGASKHLDPVAVARVWHEAGLHAVLIEGGGQVVGSFLRQGLIRGLHLLVAPRWLGHGAVPGFPFDSHGAHAWHLAAPPRALGDDVLLTYDRGEF